MSSAQRFYHYTSTAGGNAIRNDQILRSNNGVKLSTLKPEDHSRDDILRSMYGSTVPPQSKNRADNVVYVNESLLDTSKLLEIKPSLYRYCGEIKISANDVKDKPACGKRGAMSAQASTSGSSSGSQYHAQTLYHYTNESTANLILSGGKIPLNGNIILTTMKPNDYFRNEILKIIYGKNYDRKVYATYADWCIKVAHTALDANKLKEKHSKVYDYSDSIPINRSNVMDKPKCIKGGQNQNSDPQEYLYHYTNTKGAQAIKAAGFLEKSGSSGAFGVGVYMTNLKPTDFFRDDILKNNYGGINSAFKGRADWVVRVTKRNLVSSKLKSVNSNVTKDGSRAIFVYEDVVNVSSTDVYDKPKCYRAK